jgi:branched-chain amino acid transport system permease protein
LGGLVFLVIGFGAVSLGRDPNGLANLAFKVGRWVRHGRGGAGVVGRGRHHPAPAADADAITREEVSSYDAA